MNTPSHRSPQTRSTFSPNVPTLCAGKNLVTVFLSFLLLASTTCVGGKNLWEAAKEGDLERVKRLCRPGCFGLFKAVDAKAKNGDGNTPLVLAVKGAHLEVMQVLLPLDAGINAIDAEGKTALESAVKACGESLFFHKADKEGLRKRGIRLGRVAQHLLDAGADLSVDTRLVERLLRFALQSDNCLLVESLLKRGVYVDTKDKDGYIALHYAVVCGHLEVVGALLSYGSNPNSLDERKIRTPLHVAVALGFWDDYSDWLSLVKVLLAYKADPNVKGEDGKSVLHVALDRTVACARALRRSIAYLRGIDRGFADDQVDVYALSDALARARGFESGYSTLVSLVKILLESGADLEAEDESGKRALRVAFNHDREIDFESVSRKDINLKPGGSLAKVLLEHGATSDVISALEKSA